MMKTLMLATLATFIAISTTGAYALSEAEIKKAIIAESIASYPGNCPCPYNTDRAGRSCGKRSAYSRTGGYETICYPSDVTDEMIKAYLARQ